MDIQDLTLDKGKITTIHGEIYGMDYLIKEKDYYVKIFLDSYSKRIIVLDYSGPNIYDLSRRLDYIANENGFDKVFIKAKPDDWEKFIQHGYNLEGIFKYFYNGESAYSIGKFYTKERRWSNAIEEEDEIINQIIHQDMSLVEDKSQLDEQFTMRTATTDDIQQLATLYDEVFQTYPTPLNNPNYIATLMKHHNVLYKIILEGDKIISAAAADMEPMYHNAELTDCASHPDYRGMGFMGVLIDSLEQEILEKHGIITAYTLARAKSFGMNNVFYRLGYRYNGRLINNCDIMGSFEDMNLWVKKLK